MARAVTADRLELTAGESARCIRRDTGGAQSGGLRDLLHRRPSASSARRSTRRWTCRGESSRCSLGDCCATRVTQQCGHLLVGVARWAPWLGGPPPEQGQRAGVRCRLSEYSGSSRRELTLVEEDRLPSEQASAAPPVLAPDGVDQPGLDRVVPDVPKERHEVRVVLHRPALEPVLEEVPHASVLAVEPARVSHAERLTTVPIGSSAVRSTRWTWLRHEAVGQHQAAGRVLGLGQRVQEPLAVRRPRGRSRPGSPRAASRDRSPTLRVAWRRRGMPSSSSNSREAASLGTVGPQWRPA